MPIENEAKKIIGFQGFRQLVKDLDMINNEQDGPAYLLNDFSNIDDQKKSSKNRFKPFLFISQKRRELSTKLSPISFIIQLDNYIYERLRVFIVLLSVFSEFLGSIVDRVKRFIIRKMFWGRSNAFKYVLNIIIIFFVSFLFISNSYRVDVIETGQAFGLNNRVYAQEEPLVSHDILVQNTTTNTQTPVDRQSIDIVEYTVKSGDTMSGIANFFGVSEQTIKWVNDLSDAYVLQPGQVLKVPPVDGVLVKVESGDTIESLADDYEGNIQSIADFNWLDYPFTLTEGTEVFIPNGKKPEPVVPVASYYSGVVTSSAPWWSASYVDPNVGRFLSWPVAGGRGIITQYPWTYHIALDIADGGSPDLVAAAPGTVVFAGCHSGNCPAPGYSIGGSGAGWGVEVDHGNGYTTLYAHMNAIYVTSGQYVSAGQPLGQMGRSGTATGIHVHFELWQGAKWNRVDPCLYLGNYACGY